MAARGHRIDSALLCIDIATVDRNERRDHSREPCVVYISDISATGNSERRRWERNVKPLLVQSRAKLTRINDMVPKDTTLSGRRLLSGTGEVSLDVVFSVLFSGRPAFYFGGELEAGHSPIAGRFPTISAVVVAWVTEKSVEGAFDGYFKGCTLAIKTEGQVDQLLWLHWHFRGTGLRNPLLTTGGIDDPI